jgi:hypothetical protein
MELMTGITAATAARVNPDPIIRIPPIIVKIPIIVTPVGRLFAADCMIFGALSPPLKERKWQQRCGVRESGFLKMLSYWRIL